MSSPFSQDGRAEPSAIRAALAHLRPARVTSHGKVRVGARNDGGYVMLDAIAPSSRAISLGVGDNDQWDMDLAQRGLRVDQYDPALTQPLSWHVNLRFHQVRVTPHPAEGCATLADVIAPDGRGRDVLLKIDIEGAEWDVLDATSEVALARCAQICIEFHGLHRLAESRFLRRATRVFRKLAVTHVVIHVHGNNFTGLCAFGDVTVPDVLEVSFAARRMFRIVATIETFPGPHDAPNDPGRPDLDLGAFAF